MGSDDPRPRAPGRDPRRAGNGSQWAFVRRAHGDRDRRRAQDHRAGAVDRTRAHVQFRHRSHDERDPSRARLHGPAEDREVRRLLSRPLGFAAGQGRLRHADARRADLARRAARTRRAHADALVQRHRPGAAAVRRDRRGHRVRHRRAGRRQHELHSARARLPRGPARGMHEARRCADLRRSDDGIPRRERRCAGAVWHQAGPHHARQDRRRRHARRRVRRAP